MIRLLPVKSSAPATTTRIRPRQNTSPPNNFVIPKGSTPAVPAVTVVAKTAPRAINAPARTASKNVLMASMFALFNPTCSALTAIAGGSRASKVGSVGVVMRFSWFYKILLLPIVFSGELPWFSAKYPIFPLHSQGHLSQQNWDTCPLTT